MTGARYQRHFEAAAQGTAPSLSAKLSKWGLEVGFINDWPVIYRTQLLNLAPDLHAQGQLWCDLTSLASNYNELPRHVRIRLPCYARYPSKQDPI